MLGFECTINPQNLIKIVGPIFLEYQIFLSCELGKIKKTAQVIYKRTQDIEFERDRSIGLGSIIGDGQTDTHTQRERERERERDFLKHIFRLWEWCRMKNHQKIEVESFHDCNTPFTPNVAR